MKKHVLLHICCGICAGYSVFKLKSDGFKVTGFFYNPNIQPQEEYFKRLDVAMRSANIIGHELIVGRYDQEDWSGTVQDLKEEPEGGKRCFLCYRMRLERTFRKAQELDIPYFTSTLTISPHKNSQEINRIGKSIAGERFLDYDFKKENGFKISASFSRYHSLYSQNYCGCVFSKR